MRRRHERERKGRSNVTAVTTLRRSCGCLLSEGASPAHLRCHPAGEDFLISRLTCDVRLVFLVESVIRTSDWYALPYLTWWTGLVDVWKSMK